MSAGFSSSRRVVIDDSDSRIHYSGAGWFTQPGKDSGLGNHGPPYLGSQHGIKGNGNLSFTFQGTSIEVYGTNGQVPASGGFDPQWDCFVDGSYTSSRSPSSDAENNWPVCSRDGLSSGTHELVIHVKSQGQGTFWFDRLMYTPSGGTGGEALWVDYSDPAFLYDDNWGFNNIMHAAKNGATMSFDFVGKSLTWMGEIQKDGPGSPASFTYTIDQGTPVSVPINGRSPDQSIVQNNHIFFSTPVLPSGSHTLSVTYRSDNSLPLTLAYVYVFSAAVRSTSPLWSNQPESNPPAIHSSSQIESVPSPSSPSSLHSLSSSPSLTPFSPHSTIESSQDTTTVSVAASDSITSPSRVSGSLQVSPTGKSSGSGIVPIPTQVTVPGTSGHPPPWAIVAVALGAVLLLLLLILLAVFLYRRRRRTQPQPLPPSPPDLTPFIATSGNLFSMKNVSEKMIGFSSSSDGVTDPSSSSTTLISMRDPGLDVTDRPPSYAL